MLIILDNTVLTNFARVQRTDLLFAVWPDLLCTTAPVMAEYQAAGAGDIIMATPEQLERRKNTLGLIYHSVPQEMNRSAWC